ncbi:MAG: FAD binding domain-containing protein, partial [Planctomycetes bacterium]|nr:FAD binding domain-containing protein [Planctomycetota bacterium]
MKNFEYAAPITELDALDLLSPEAGKTAVLAGGTDLVGLMKRMVETPERVVHIGNIESLRRIELDRQNDLWVGAAVHLDEFLDHPLTNVYPAINQVIEGISSLQLRSQGTIGGATLDPLQRHVTLIQLHGKLLVGRAECPLDARPAQEQLPDAFARLRDELGLREAAILSTCNRVEIYAGVPDMDGAVDRLGR